MKLEDYVDLLNRALTVPLSVVREEDSVLILHLPEGLSLGATGRGSGDSRYYTRAEVRKLLLRRSLLCSFVDSGEVIE